MFWTGMLIFGILAILPLTAAILLNKHDGSRLNESDPVTTPSDSEF